MFYYRVASNHFKIQVHLNVVTFSYSHILQCCSLKQKKKVLSCIHLLCAKYNDLWRMFHVLFPLKIIFREMKSELPLDFMKC